MEEKLRNQLNHRMTGKKCVMHQNQPLIFLRICCLQVRASVDPLTDVHGQSINKVQEIVETLLLQYKSVFRKLVEDKIVYSPMDFFNQGPHHISHLTDISFNNDNIQQAIKGVANNSAAGTDQFPAVLLKKYTEELSVPLLNFY